MTTILKLFFILTTLILFQACKAYRCIGNETAIKEFEHRLDFIKNAEENNSIIFVEDYRNAIFFLGKVTGIISKANYDHSIGYINKEDYRHDMSAWSKWLKNNKCKLTRQYVDSIIDAGKY